MRGITINNDFHTGYDLNMVMTEKILTPPEAQTYEVEIPGRNGFLDMSDYLTGEPTYKNRTLSFSFFGNGSRETVLSLIDRMSSLHGYNMQIEVDDLEGWYFEGRASVSYTDKY